MKKITITKNEKEITVEINEPSSRSTKNSISFGLTNENSITNDNIAEFLTNLGSELLNDSDGFKVEYEIEKQYEKDEQVKFVQSLLTDFVNNFKEEYTSQQETFKNKIKHIKSDIEGE
ncbi:MAG: hypothetical protein LBL60_00440 [Mycoplasmataceae bacterium]|jgi:hypothetical protein|nr:hypothetical protein [Mycoplasmataceae bacterium]